MNEKIYDYLKEKGNETEIPLVEFVPKLYDIIGKAIPQKCYETHIKKIKSFNSSRCLDVTDIIQIFSPDEYQFECLWKLVVDISGSDTMTRKLWDCIVNWIGNVDSEFFDKIEKFINETTQYLHSHVNTNVNRELSNKPLKSYLLQPSKLTLGEFIISYTVPPLPQTPGSGQPSFNIESLKIHRTCEGKYIYNGKDPFASITDIISDLKASNVIQHEVHGDFWVWKQYNVIRT